MRRRTLILLLACWISVHCAPVAKSAEPIKAVRGIANHVDIEYGSRVQSRADQSPTSTVLVRVSPLAGGTGGAPLRQRVEFIGTVAGTFDLRDFIEREDGRAITELAALPIVIGSQLPADAGTDLYSSGSSRFNWAAHYRLLLWSAIAIWAVIPVAYFALRAMRRPTAIPPIAVVAPPPSIESQLIEAIRSSAARPLTADERGQLELLVFRYFGGAATPSGVSGMDIAETFRRVRENPETRPVITALERWLHAHDGERARGEATSALEELRRSHLISAQSANSGLPIAQEAVA